MMVIIYQTLIKFTMYRYFLLILLTVNFFTTKNFTYANSAIKTICGGCIPTTPFRSVWRLKAGDTVQLPLVGHYCYDFSVDWGDGHKEKFTSHKYQLDQVVKHQYKKAGDYTVTITGTHEAWSFFSSAIVSNEKLIAVPELGNVCWRSFHRAFYGCKNLFTFKGGDTRYVTDMSYMFYRADNVTPQTGHWDTANVTNMRWMFRDTVRADPDVSKWNTTKVTNMQGMFSGAIKANPDVSKWNTANVVHMHNMFTSTTTANPDVSNWNTAKVTLMTWMFAFTKAADPDISRWDFSSLIKKDGSHQMFFRSSATSWRKHRQRLHAYGVNTRYIDTLK